MNEGQINSTKENLITDTSYLYYLNTNITSIQQPMKLNTNFLLFFTTFASIWKEFIWFFYSQLQRIKDYYS